MMRELKTVAGFMLLYAMFALLLVIYCIDGQRAIDWLFREREK